MERIGIVYARLDPATYIDLETTDSPMMQTSANHRVLAAKTAIKYGQESILSDRPKLRDQRRRTSRMRLVPWMSPFKHHPASTLVHFSCQALSRSANPIGSSPQPQAPSAFNAVAGNTMCQ